LKLTAVFLLLFPFTYLSSAAVTPQYLGWHKISPFEWINRNSTGHCC